MSFMTLQIRLMLFQKQIIIFHHVSGLLGGDGGGLVLEFVAEKITTESCLVLSCFFCFFFLSCLASCCLAVIFCDVLCCAMLCCVVLCSAVLFVLFCLALSCLVLSCLVTVLSCLVLSCLVLSCRIVSYRIVSCRVLHKRNNLVHKGKDDVIRKERLALKRRARHRVNLTLNYLIFDVLFPARLGL
jgi:hypothetical protein